jgi:hypothetical protein
MTSFKITDVYTSKSVAGKDQPYAPMIGEQYRLTIEFDVEGTPTAPYPVSFKMADRYKTVQVVDLSAGHKSRSASFFLALDDVIPWEVDIDPYHYADGVDPTKSPMPIEFPDVYGQGTQSVRSFTQPFRTLATAKDKGTFVPEPPPKAIDYYDTINAIAFQHFEADLQPGSPLERMVVMMGCPSSEGWQKVKSSNCFTQSGAGSWSIVTRPVMNPSQYPIHYWDQQDLPSKPVTIHQTANLELSNVRVDPTLLRAVTWNALDNARSGEPYSFYSKPEPVIESTDPKISQYVHDVIGSSYRQSMTPYDAARKLYQAVLARTTYYFPAPGTPDLRPPTAKGMAEKGFGDCGGFSILLVALFRNIGFAARTSCGVWVGLDAAHCWCEVYFPGHGWLICDGSLGNGQCEDGEFAYYFGNIPDLNRRFANMRGNTFNVGDVKTFWLQGPFHKIWDSVASPAIKSHTILLDFRFLKFPTAESEKAKVQRFEPDFASIFAVRRCPCAEHGGFSQFARRQRLS